MVAWVDVLVEVDHVAAYLVKFGILTQLVAQGDGFVRFLHAELNQAKFVSQPHIVKKMIIIAFSLLPPDFLILFLNIGHRLENLVGILNLLPDLDRCLIPIVEK